MTIDEYKKQLSDLTDKKLQQFIMDFGGDFKTVEQLVRHFVDHPEHERRICQLLGLKTEAEKLTDAALQSANAAAQSARSAKLSVICSIIAAVAALTATVITIINLFIN